MTGDTPTFSVVVPALNLERTIAAAIRSVLDQTAQDFEVIVVDDGSTDRTAAVVQSLTGDSRVRLLRGASSGVAAARNAGVCSARGAVVALLDGDDLWLPTFLQEMGDALARDPEARFAYTDAWVWAEWHRRFSRSTGIELLDPPHPMPTSSSTLFRELLRRNFLLSTAVIRREVFDEIGLFRTSLQACSDYEYWLRIASHGGRGVFVSGPLAVYRRRRESITGDARRLSEGSEQVLRIVAEEYDLSDELRGFAKAALQSSAPREPSSGPARALRWTEQRARRLASVLVRPLRWFSHPPARLREAFPDLMMLLGEEEGTGFGAERPSDPSGVAPGSPADQSFAER